uniref:Tetratricopeptide repeat protein 7 N-terminal domain-containing protein n=1 Tax=Caenorhabditis japonica TaxID=281687 RepID=A0A8R1HZ01_CAEJA
MSKLKGSRLETEVDRVRADANWKRFTELLPSVKSKNSGLEECYEMFQGEIILETYFDQLGEIVRPNKEHVEKLSPAEQLLSTALRENGANQTVKIEANILLAKVLYSCFEFKKALACISNSEMENGKTPFRTLRTLRLVAEGYAIKGLCIESMEEPSRSHSNSATSQTSTSSSSKDQKALYVFEKSAELAIFYINELEKSMNSSTAKAVVTGSLVAPASAATNAGIKQQEKIGELLERIMERVAIIRAKDTAAKKQSSGTEGIEWYRKIITCLGDKYTGERLKQKLSRQFAELLIRATVPIEEKSMSEAMQTKAQNMKLYHGSHKTFYTPKSKIEEIILLLLINEVLTTREVVLSQSEELTSSRILSLQNAKSSYNLLTLFYTERFDSEQFYSEASSISLQFYSERVLFRGSTERLGIKKNIHRKLTHRKTTQKRFRFRAAEEPNWETKKSQLAKAVTLIEECVSADPHDYLSLYYAAYFHAIARDLESAKDRCSRSLALNGDQPAAVMLLALIFTAYGDLKGALELVINALGEFEHNYGLMVLRLHIETRFGRIEESLDTCTHLLDFWKRNQAASLGYQQFMAYSAGIDEERSQKTLNGADGSVLMGREGSQKTGTPSLGRELSTPLATTPLFPAFPTSAVPLISAMPSNASVMDLSVAESIHGAGASEIGAPPSTASDSLNNGIGDAWSKFRTQADVWMCLAELYIAEGRHEDLTKVIEQAISMFPSSPQAFYLKVRSVLEEGLERIVLGAYWRVFGLLL